MRKQFKMNESIPPVGLPPQNSKSTIINVRLTELINEKFSRKSDINEKR